MNIQKTFSFSTSLLLTCFLWFVSFTAAANPQGGQVVEGQVSVIQESPTKLKIIQGTNKAIREWDSFNIDADEHTQVIQPSANSILLNRVTGGDPSKILGQLTANGKIFLVNRNGVLIGKNARIDVGGLLVSTHDILNKNFMEGNYVFDIPGKPGASIINEGTITIKEGGIAAFVAPSVRNSGLIVAKLGKVTLASANGFTLDLYGDELITLMVDEKVAKTAFDLEGNQLDSFVENAGKIQANGGYVVLTANAAREAINAVVNQSGIIEAKSIGEHNGVIKINGGDYGVVENSGTLDVSSTDAKAGTIVVTGEEINLTDTAHLDASSKTGSGKVFVGGDYLGGQASDETYAELGIKKEDKEIKTAQKVTFSQGAVINGNASESGEGVKIVLWSDKETQAHGTITANGADKGGLIEVSSKDYMNIDGLHIEAKNGTVLYDPKYIIVDDSTVSGDYDVDFDGTTRISARAISDMLNNGTNVILKTYTQANLDSPDFNPTTVGDFFINSPIYKTQGGDAKLAFYTGNYLKLADNVEISSTSGKLNVLLDATSAYAIAPEIILGYGSLIKTNGGTFEKRTLDFINNGTIDTSVNNPPADTSTSGDTGGSTTDTGTSNTTGTTTDIHTQPSGVDLTNAQLSLVQELSQVLNSTQQSALESEITNATSSAEIDAILAKYEANAINTGTGDTTGTTTNTSGTTDVQTQPSGVDLTNAQLSLVQELSQVLNSTDQGALESEIANATSSAEIDAILAKYKAYTIDTIGTGDTAGNTSTPDTGTTTDNTASSTDSGDTNAGTTVDSSPETSGESTAGDGETDYSELVKNKAGVVNQGTINAYHAQNKDKSNNKVKDKGGSQATNGDTLKTQLKQVLVGLDLTSLQRAELKKVIASLDETGKQELVDAILGGVDDVNGLLVQFGGTAPVENTAVDVLPKEPLSSTKVGSITLTEAQDAIYQDLSTKLTPKEINDLDKAIASTIISDEVGSVLASYAKPTLTEFQEATYQNLLSILYSGPEKSDQHLRSNLAQNTH